VWDEEELHLYAVKGVGTHPIQAHILESDTGAAVTIMSQHEHQQMFPGVPLKKSSELTLRSFFLC